MGFFDNLKQQAIYDQVKKLLKDRNLKGILITLNEGDEINFEYYDHDVKAVSEKEQTDLFNFVKKLKKENEELKKTINLIQTK